MELDTIITHGGGAHRDEFLACCLLLNECPAPIERRDPTEADLENPRVAVVDIGHHHEPGKMNFDHHQFPREAEPSCALSLVLQHLGLYDSARQFSDWLEATEYFDCRGPKETGEWLGVTPEQMRRLDSPIDPTILRLFSHQATHLPGEPLWEVMRAMGAEWVAYIRGMIEQIRFLEQYGEIWQVGQDDNAFEVFAILNRNAPLGDATTGVALHLKALQKDESVVALAYPDNRSEGFGLRKFNDSPLLDFSRLDAEPDVHFTHKRGFIAKTSAQTTERLREHLMQAWVG